MYQVITLSELTICQTPSVGESASNSNLDLTLETLTQKNPFLTVIIGDFNAKFNKWCSTDKTTPEGAKLDNLTSIYPSLHENCHHQIIKQ